MLFCFRRPARILTALAVCALLAPPAVAFVSGAPAQPGGPVAVSVATPPGPVDLRADVSALRGDVERARVQLAQSELSTAQAAQFELRISTLEQELRQMTGRLEDLDFRIRQQSQRLDRFESESNARLLRLEQGQPGGPPVPDSGISFTPPDGSGQTVVGAAPQPGTDQFQTAQPQQVQPAAPPQAVQSQGQFQSQQGAPGSQPGPLQPQTLGTISDQDLAQIQRGGATVQPPIGRDELQGAAQAPAQLSAQPPAVPSTQQAAAPASLPQNDPDAAYSLAFDQLRQMNYPAAESAFGQYLQLYPSSPLAGNAKYWLGETHYVRGDYETAAVIFAEGYQTYPESGKAPDNLLKLGMSLANLGANQDACATFGELQRRYPNAAPTILQRAQREASRLGC